MSTFFTFILHRQKRGVNYVPGRLQNNLLSFMNKYNLFTPYIIHRNQTILLDTVGLDYFYDPDNFGSLNQPYVVIFFNIKPRDIGQYFYVNKFLSQNKIYFNALNNYSTDYIYTNIAASVKTDKNSIEKIYSVNGLPLSFVDITQLQYAYEGQIAIRWMEKPLQDNPSVPFRPSVLPKYAPNGKRQFTSYNNILFIQTEWYEHTWDKLLIYNLQERCKYLLINNPQVKPQIPIDGSLNICSVCSLTDTTSSTSEIKTNIEPYIFDLPININALYGTVQSVPENPTNWALVSSFNNIVQLPSSTSELYFDVILGSKTPLYGNKTLRLTNNIRPYDLISYSNVIVNFTVTPNGTVTPTTTGGSIYRFEIKQEKTASVNQLGITFKHVSDTSTWPDRFVTYQKALGTWTNNVFLETNTYYDITYFVWDTKILVGQLDIPANTWKTWIISNRVGRDYLYPNSYLQTTRDLKRPTGDLSLIDLNKREFGLPSWFSPRNVRTCEMGIWPIMNLTSFFDYDLSEYWRLSPTVSLADTGISGNTLSGNYMAPSLDSNVLSAITETLLYNTAYTQATVDTNKIYYHAVDENPFTDGVRITRPFFNYKQYFQMKNFPYFMIKKSFDLVNDMDYIDNTRGLMITKKFRLTTIQFTQYTEISCFVLPTYTNTTYADADKRSRGIAIKCSLSQRRRGIFPYLFLEQGGRPQFTWDKFNLASEFDFAIYYPPNKTDIKTQTTVYRNVTSQGITTNIMDIYLLFK